MGSVAKPATRTIEHSHAHKYLLVGAGWSLRVNSYHFWTAATRAAQLSRTKLTGGYWARIRPWYVGAFIKSLPESHHLHLQNSSTAHRSQLMPSSTADLSTQEPYQMMVASFSAILSSHVQQHALLTAALSKPFPLHPCMAGKLPCSVESRVATSFPVGGAGGRCRNFYEELQQLPLAPCEAPLLMSICFPGFTTALPGASASTCTVHHAQLQISTKLLHTQWC
jgi:hypothetical protein